MSELTQSVVVCNLDGRILLYNSRARLRFKALSEASGFSGGELIGLGRSIYSVLERNLITHALESIQHRLKKQAGQPRSTNRGNTTLWLLMWPSSNDRTKRPASGAATTSARRLALRPGAASAPRCAANCAWLSTYVCDAGADARGSSTTS